MTITLTREEAQQVLDCLAFSSINLADEMTKTLRTRLAQPETPYEIGKSIYREGKGISFIPTAVERDDQIGEALRGFEDARLAQPEPEYKSYQCQQCGEVIGWLGRVMPFHKCAQPEPEPELEVKFEQVANGIEVGYDFFGGVDIRLGGEFVYVHINYDPRYTHNAARTQLADKIVGLLTGNTAPPQRVYCSRGDGIVADDGALCGTCASLREREWQGLTDEERTYLAWESNNGPHCVSMTEAKLREKNGGA